MERGTHPDADQGRVTWPHLPFGVRRDARVDAERRQSRQVVEGQVGSGIAKLAPAMVALHHAALQVRTHAHARGCFQVTGCNRHPDPVGRDDLLTLRDLLDGHHLEAPFAAKLPHACHGSSPPTTERALFRHNESAQLERRPESG